MILLAVYVVLVFLYSLVSQRLERTIVTAPVIFTVAGMLGILLNPDVQGRENGLEMFLRLAEIGLVLLLFVDASRTDIKLLKNIRDLPARLLGTGMLLTILTGSLVALVVFHQLTIWEAGILAAILAPTDAGLGQVIVNSPNVPVKIRQALNVEAGLNDGLSVPFLLFFIALAGPSEGPRLSRFIVEQLGFGLSIGVVIGFTGGWLLAKAGRRRWIEGSWQQIALVTLPLLCALASEAAGASMFIASFIAGLFIQVHFKDVRRKSVEFTEQWGHLLNLSVFFLLGLLVALAWRDLDWTYGVYAVLSLTVVRMVPVALALIGSRLNLGTVLFMGWFGPRGLASIVLGLVYLEHGTQHPGETTIKLAVLATVLLSTFAHGFSALPGTRLYAQRVSTLPPGAPEFAGSEEGSPASERESGSTS